MKEIQPRNPEQNGPHKCIEDVNPEGDSRHVLYRWHYSLARAFNPLQIDGRYAALCKDGEEYDDNPKAPKPLGERPSENQRMVGLER